MKKSIISSFSFIIALVTISIIHSSSSNGRAFAGRQGNTGAPGESTTCRSCHGSGFGTTVSIDVKDSQGNSVSSYVPGNIYTVDFTVNTTSGNPSRYGYQLVSLLPGNAAYNAWSNPSGNTRIASAGVRSYAEHAGKSVSPNFSVSWTAPTAGSGNVRIFGAGAAVNNNGGTSGDGGNTTSITLTENTNTSIDEVTLDEISIYPNPIKDQLNLVLNHNSLIEIINLNGQIVLEEQLQNGSNSVDLNALERGVYILRATTNKRIHSRRIVLK